ncbi:MAG: flavodoxin domain-containing protein [Anaerolineales bacterium]|jgi:menaquinone-dependent protoporphyrinogen oxidase
MANSVLIAYASKYGATKEIAEKIGEVLRQSGLTAEVQPADGIKDVSSYQAVVLGSAVYVGKWRKQAVKFLNANSKTLANIPVWIFSSGPTGEGDPVELLNGWRMPESIQPVLDHIQPRDVVVFHGKLDADKLNFIERRMIKMVEAKIGDFRDWTSIQSWAEGIADNLS